MTKLEFIDKINDILIGLNTAESDALGSLYDELMRDNNWQQVRIQAAIAAMQGLISNPQTAEQIDHDERYKQIRGGDKTQLVAIASMMYADALVEELQKKGGDQ